MKQLNKLLIFMFILFNLAVITCASSNLGNHLILNFNNGQVGINTSKISGTAISCHNITDGSDTDFCVDDGGENSNCSADMSCDPIFYDSEHTKAAHYSIGVITLDNLSFVTDNAYDTLDDFTGTLTDGKICRYDEANGEIDCDYTDQSGSDNYVNITGDTMTGNLNMSGYSLTDVGELIVTTITLKGNLIPYITDLYNIGNSTNWINEIWAKKGYFDSLNASQVNTTNLNADNMDANIGDIDNLTSTIINLGNNKIQNSSGNIEIILGG